MLAGRRALSQSASAPSARIGDAAPPHPALAPAGRIRSAQRGSQRCAIRSSRPAPDSLSARPWRHPDHRIEWWYFTGWLAPPDGKPLGFQITFFRSRPALAQDNPSAFAPKQILFAHAALSDPGHRQAGPRPAHGAIRLRDRGGRHERCADRLARLEPRAPPGRRFLARTPAKAFGLDLTFTPRQPAMANGDRGYSRKGPRPEQASYYYSIPHLKVAAPCCGAASARR
jgi:predicted secreted hydrolase